MCTRDATMLGRQILFFSSLSSLSQLRLFASWTDVQFNMRGGGLWVGVGWGGH